MAPVDAPSTTLAAITWGRQELYKAQLPAELGEEIMRGMHEY
jgi:hypothetical protein